MTRYTIVLITIFAAFSIALVEVCAQPLAKCLGSQSWQRAPCQLGSLFLPLACRSSLDTASSRAAILKIEPHFGDNLLDKARELVETKPDVIWAGGLLAAHAACAATQNIPIIAIAEFLKEAGLIEGLTRPGGNLSGITGFAGELNVKRLTLLHELLPAARRVVLLREPAYEGPRRANGSQHRPQRANSGF